MFRYRSGKTSPRDAIALFDEGIAAARTEGRLDVVGSANINRGYLYTALGDVAMAEEATLEALAYYRSVGSARAEATCLRSLASIAGVSDHERAHALAHEAAALLVDEPNRIVRAASLLTAAWFSLECRRIRTPPTASCTTRGRRSSPKARKHGSTRVPTSLPSARSCAAIARTRHSSPDMRRRGASACRHDPPPPYVTARLTAIVAAAGETLGREAAERRRREGASAGVQYISQLLKVELEQRRDDRGHARVDRP